MKKIINFIKNVYSAICGFLISCSTWTILWFFVIRRLFGLEDGFGYYLTFLIPIILIGIYYGFILSSQKEVSRISTRAKKVLFIVNITIGSILLLPLIFILYWSFAMSVLFSSPCGSIQHSKIMSSIEFYATYVTKNCGATTYFTEEVSVDNTDVFRAQIRSNVEIPLKIEWIDFNTLFISLASKDIKDVCIFKLKTSSYTPLNGNVAIKYDPSITNAKCSRFENKKYE